KSVELDVLAQLCCDSWYRLEGTDEARRANESCHEQRVDPVIGTDVVGYATDANHCTHEALGRRLPTSVNGGEAVVGEDPIPQASTGSQEDDADRSRREQPGHDRLQTRDDPGLQRAP